MDIKLKLLMPITVSIMVNMTKRMKKIITFFLLCISVNSYSQKPKNIIVEYNPQSAFIQFYSTIKIENKNGVKIYEDFYGHSNSFPYNSLIGKKTATLINLTEADYPLKFSLRGQTLYTDNCNEDKEIVFTLEKYNSLGTESLFACTASAEIRAFYLDNPETNDNVSSCDVINIKDKPITNYYYRHPVSGEWIDIYTVAPNAILYNSINTNDLNLKINEVPDLIDYYGPLFLKGSYTVDGLYDSFVTTQEGDAAPINVYSKTFETNIIIYNITPCTPVITTTSSQNFTSCSYSQDGAVTFTFERELQDGEQYEMALFYQNGAAVLDGNKTITKNSMTTPTTYTWTNLPSENYKLTYYTKKTVGSKEYLSNPPLQKRFTISSPQLFSFIATETQPKCYGEKGRITITASGGTPPYYYYLNDDPKIEFTSPLTIEVNAGNNSIKVEDNKNCIDNTKNDTKS
jgi:hypothetical protein